MTTVTQIISLALKDSGVIGESQTASSETMNDALTTLNSMLALWNIQNLLSFADTSETVAISGAESYSLTNQNQDIAVYYFNGSVDSEPYSLKDLTYSEFTGLLTQSGVPNYYNIELTSTGSTLRLNPNPSSGNVKVVERNNIGSLSLTDTLNLPKSYELPIRFNLALLLCTTFGLTPSTTLIQQATNFLNTIKSTNSRIPVLKGYRRGRFNILTNGYNNG